MENARAKADASAPDGPRGGDVLTTKEAAHYLRQATRTLEKWRNQGTGPVFMKSGKSVRYKRADLLEFCEKRTCRSTSDPNYTVTGFNLNER